MFLSLSLVVNLCFSDFMRRETLGSDFNEQKSSSEKDHLIMCPLPMLKLCASVCVYFGAFVYLCISVFVYLPRSASEWERGVLGKRTLSLSSDLLPADISSD